MNEEQRKLYTLMKAINDAWGTDSVTFGKNCFYAYARTRHFPNIPGMSTLLVRAYEGTPSEKSRG